MQKVFNKPPRKVVSFRPDPSLEVLEASQKEEKSLREVRTGFHAPQASDEVPQNLPQSNAQNPTQGAQSSTNISSTFGHPTKILTPKLSFGDTTIPKGSNDASTFSKDLIRPCHQNSASNAQKRADTNQLLKKEDQKDDEDFGRALLNRRVNFQKCLTDSLAQSSLEEGGALLQLKQYFQTDQIDISWGGLCFLALKNFKRLVIATGQEGMVEIYDIENDQLVWEFDAKTSYVMKVIRVPLEEKDIIATCCFEGNIYLWDVGNNYKFLNAFEYHMQATHALVFIKENQIMVSGGMDGMLYAWTIRECKHKGQLDCKVEVSCLCSMQDRKLGVGLGDGCIKIVIISAQSSLTQDFSWKAHESFVSDLHQLENKDILISGSRDGFIKIWNIGKHKENLYTLDGKAPVSRIVIYEERELIISSHADHFLRTWDMKSGKMLGERHDITFGNAFESTKDGQIISSTNYIVGVWNLQQFR